MTPPPDFVFRGNPLLPGLSQSQPVWVASPPVRPHTLPMSRPEKDAPEALAEMLKTLPSEYLDKRARALLEEVEGLLPPVSPTEPAAVRTEEWRAQVARARSIAMANLLKSR